MSGHCARRHLADSFPGDMSPREQDRIGIVGLGAVGGSLALALRDSAPVLAWARDPADRASARAAGIRVCREGDSTWLDEMTRTSVVVIAVPLDEVALVARDVVPRLSDDALVLHTASLQTRDALGMTDTEFKRVLGTHPIAGSERSGFGAADAATFRGATIRADARAASSERRRLEMVWRLAGIDRFVWGDAAEHDQLMSWVSHLPQIASTALAAALAQEGITHADVGPGARDATRLASSDFRMWAPILRTAPRESVVALRRLTSLLEAFVEALEQHDSTSVTSVWERARAWRTSTETPV
jgi:prephenate dehydrogenase